MNLFPLQRCDLHDTFDNTSMFVLCFLILRKVSSRQFTGVLQGIAIGIGISNFLQAFLMVCLNSSSFGSMKKIPPGPRFSVRWPFVQKNESCETCLEIFFLHPRFGNHQFFLQQYIQWCMSGSGNVDVLRWNKKWFFFRNVQFDSGFHVMAIMKSPVKDKKSFLASATSRVESSWRGVGEESPSDSPRRTTSSSPRSGRSLIEVDVLRRRSPPGVFDCSIRDWEFEVSTSIWRKNFLCVRCVHLLQFFNVCDHNVSFPDYTRVQCITEKYTWEDFWTKFVVISICPSQS